MARNIKRRTTMVKLLESEGVLLSQDMAKQFKVSKETIRKDFDTLSELEGIQRIHGGIKILKKGVLSKDYIFEERKNLNIESKKAIAFKALSFIDDGSTIFLDSGSTIAYLFQYLNFKKCLKVVTSSIPLLTSYLEKNTKDTFDRCGHELIFVGGHISHNMLTTYGTFFDLMVSHINIDKLFISGDAFDENKGLSNADDVAFSVVQALRPQASQCIVLVDGSKVKSRATYQCLTIKDMDVVITDYEFSEDVYEKMYGLKTKLVQVKTK